MGLSKRFNTSIAAGATNANLLSDVIGQRVGPERTGHFRVKLTVPVGNAGEIEAEVFASGRTLKERSVVPIETSVGLGPDINTPVFVSEPVVNGEELIVRCYSSGAGAVVVACEADQVATG